MAYNGMDSAKEHSSEEKKDFRIFRSQTPTEAANNRGGTDSDIYTSALKIPEEGPAASMLTGQGGTIERPYHYTFIPGSHFGKLALLGGGSYLGDTPYVELFMHTYEAHPEEATSGESEIYNLLEGHFTENESQ